MHPVLRRQTRRALGVDPEDMEAMRDVPEPVRALVAVVDATYLSTDDDRRLLEHALEQTSGELLARNRRLDEENRRLYTAEAALRRASQTDALTSLPNRASFQAELERRVARSRRHPHARFAVAFVDLDRFKAINDSRGHGVGDVVLREVASRLSRAVRKEDMVARLGGDEFAIILDGNADAQSASASVARLAAVISEPLFVDRLEVRITASIGIAVDAGAVGNAEELLRNADIAMYRAKGAGRARQSVFDRGMYEEVAHRYNLESDLRVATERGQMRLVFQPVYAIGTGRPIAMEALLRWNHPTRGNIPPSEFIPLAEETGAILEIGDWVVEETCRHLSAWADRLPEGVYATLNVSARQLIEPRLASRIVSALERWRLDPRLLGLELTETSVLVDGGSPDVLKKLRQAGLRVLVDDFGTGWSTLANLLRVEADVIKIDRVFVTNAAVRGPEFLRALLMLARAVGAATVVEGVETAEEMEMIRALGADAVQGYLLSRPVEAEDLLRTLWLPGSEQ